MRSPDPNVDGREIKVVDILDQSVRELDDVYFENDPLLLAQMSYSLGRTYSGLGQLDDAESLVHNAFSIYQREYGSSDRKTLEVGNILAVIYRRRENPQYLDFISESGCD